MEDAFNDLGSLSAPAAPRAKESKPGKGMVIALIFLIPYSILITILVVLLLMRDRPLDPLERLPDPTKKGKGPPRQVELDLPLPAHLVTQLGEAIQVGALLVLPQSVEKSADGDLVLTLKMKNLSSHLAFIPITDDFLRYAPDNPDLALPLTYLKSDAAKAEDDENCLFGGYLEWSRGAPGNEIPGDGELGPNEEE